MTPTPKSKEHRSAGEFEQDSCTRRKKTRRVSFAETTVHVFKRDEESSSSPANSTPITGESCGVSESEKTICFGGIQSNGSDSAEAALEEEEEGGSRSRFLRGIDSSSPGSAADSSPMSGDDDNFFGPVSTSLINSGHLSDSSVADYNNHDITLDSTAFSLHFRNIAFPDDKSANSAGSLRTPAIHKMPNMPLSYQVRTENSEDMSSKSYDGEMSSVSLDWSKSNPSVGGSHDYDYGKLSATLEGIMDEVKLRMQQKSPIGDHRLINSNCQTDEVEGIGKPGKDGEEVSNQNSCYDDPGRIVRCRVSPMGSPMSNESLPHAKTKALTSHSSEKIKVESSYLMLFLFPLLE